ncbi:MAG TPA: hypothetical protein PLE19_10710 [Planctomycetota bacterium]|nr:hypothetical protein [Planctomycetota bacterium]HRR79039.1 hypothetical protein [Planctomycetota bacterium]HRT95492.1 hypothetical protein [Planctomycetota bacterium]
MPKAKEDIDWYVDMSERLERREENRRYVILAICVAVPLVLMGAFVLYAVLMRSGKLRQWLGDLTSPRAETPAAAKELPLGPVSVKSLQKTDIRFQQLDTNGIPTSITFFFRELKPEQADVFTVNRETDVTGTILSYRLLNIGTADVYEFANVQVRLIGAEWTITEEGWKTIRDALQAKMNVPLGLPGL